MHSLHVSSKLNEEKMIEMGNKEIDFNNGFKENNMSQEIDENEKDILINWSIENENILSEWCDIAQCYKWMNSKAHSKYSLFNAMFTIPAIIFSTISGTASFSINSLPTSAQIYAPIIIGSVNIFVGILTTIQQYLKIAELNESHRVASISWDKFARNIRIELSKSPDERMDAGQFIKICRQEYDRLMESSPSIPDYIIKEFNDTFSGKPGSSTRKRYEELTKPDICDVIISVNKSKNKWYLEKDKYKYTRRIQKTFKEHDFNKEKQDKLFELQEEKIKDKMLQEKNRIKDDENRIKKEDYYKNELEMIRKNNLNNEKINDYINRFYSINGRKPLTDEIIDNLKNTVDNNILSHFLEKYTIEETINNGSNHPSFYENPGFVKHKNSKDSTNDSFVSSFFTPLKI